MDLELESERSGWKQGALHAILISLFIHALFYYWFVVANRYLVFLYEHMGSTPFDPVTSSRYWMTGFVASGLLLILYTSVQWLVGRLAIRRGVEVHPPDWRQVWLCCLPLLTTGILIITMTQNRPTLPFWLGVACVGSTMIGLALALISGELAARRPGYLLWLAADGMALVPGLLLIRALELPGQGIRLPFGERFLFLVVGGSVVAGAVWLAIMTGLRAWRQKSIPGPGAVLAAGFAICYLLFPVMHYLLGRPGFPYISTGSNFFARNPIVQLTTWIIAIILAFVVTRLRTRLKAKPDVN